MKRHVLLLLVITMGTCNTASSAPINDGRPHKLLNPSGFKAVVYRSSPVSYFCRFTEESTEYLNDLSIVAFSAQNQQSYQTRRIAIYVRRQEREGATNETVGDCTLPDCRLVATRLNDLLRIGRIWRNEGVGSEKTKEFKPTPCITLTLQRASNDATLWWSISNGKEVFSSNILEDLSKFTTEFSIYTDWLAEQKAIPTRRSSQRTVKAHKSQLSHSTISRPSSQPSDFVRASGGVYFGGENGHWISDVAGDGSLITLEDNSIWQVAPIDKITSTLWLAISDIVVTDSTNPAYPYTLVNTDDHETVEARLLQQ